MGNVQHGHELTQSQLLMWTGQELNPQAPLYNMALVFDLHGKIQVNAFRNAFFALIEQSDAMRTVFKVENGLPKQFILDKAQHDFVFYDWASNAEKKATVRAWLAERCQAMMNLSVCSFDSVLIKISDEHYIWFFNQHHLTTDASSTAVLYKAMARLYKKALANLDLHETNLPPFVDYIAFEQESRLDPKKKKIHQFWREKLPHIPKSLQLYGFDGKVKTSRTQRFPLELGIERSQKLRALTKEKDIRSWTEHLSLYTIFTTVLFTWMHRVTGQHHLAIGTPAHNRPNAVFKETAGVFVEFFPLIAEIEENESFSSLLQRVRVATNEFLKNAHPGTSTAEMSRQFNVVLNYINAEFSDFNGIPMTSEWIHTQHCDPQHHVRLHVHDFDVSGNIQLYFDLNEDVFDDVSQERVTQDYLTLLDAFIEDRTQAIFKHGLLTPAEHQTFIDHYRIMPNDQIDKVCVNQLIEGQAKVSPDAVALRYHNQAITYQTLDQEANRLAHYLQQQGIEQGDRVALFLKRSPMLIIGILGVMKVGGTYVPIASDYPENRIKYMLNDADISIVLSQKTIRDRLPHTDKRCVLLDHDWDRLISHQPSVKPEVIQNETDLVYLMYTSGSTGKPKGVMISHQSLANYVQWAKMAYIDMEKPSFPLFTMIGFDLTVTSIYVPLITGGSIHIYEETATGPDFSLLEVIEDNAIDIIKLTPSHLSLLKDKEIGSSTIRKMIVGGENFRMDLAKAIHDKFGDQLTIYNEYGPTEATVGCIVYQFRSTDPYPSVPIGQPISNMSAFVLDTGGHPVPQGVPGELYLQGVGLSTGYWQRAGLTSESFVRNPTITNQQMYRTGDLVRELPSGDLMYLGRMDEQVKVGGVRIELGEIETALARHPSIRECVVDLDEPQHAKVNAVSYCSRCGLPSNYPTAAFNEENVCGLCRSFEVYQRKAKQYFKEVADLKRLFEERKTKKDGQYDCLMLLSGGKDSTYALGQLVEMGLNVLAFTLDNGYISQQAKDNITRVITELGVDHIFGETPAMNAIFVDSLQRHNNVCNGCFKALYTLSTQVALEKGIPYIITGLSRGQFFETRLTEELFWDEKVDIDAIDDTILTARKAYHRVEDAVCKLMDVSMFASDDVFEKVQFVDFYRYTDVSLDDMLTYLDERLPWVRPTDTGRSTNCLINQVGIYVHKKNVGYNNYAFPYSWDVRIGHKTRVAALDEINEEVNEQEVKTIMEEIGYVEQNQDTSQQLIAYYVGSQVEASTLRDFLSKYLPAYLIPAQYIALERMPLTSNGKVDRQKLMQLRKTATLSQNQYIAPRNPFEEMLAEIWEEVLQLESIGVEDDFIAIGGNSLAAIRLIARINEAFQLDFSVNIVFEYPSIAQLAVHIEETIRTLMEAE